jgi:type I restriction enzyme S subunit
LNTTLFVEDFLGNDLKFAFYWFVSVDLSGFDSGSVQPMLNRNYIADVQVSLPPVAEQKAIAATLGALDDKIESNRRVQTIGESLIRAMVEKELSSSGGRTGTLSEYCELAKDSAKPSDISESDNYIGLEHMPRGSLFIESWGCADGVASNKWRFREGDILFGKLRPYFKKVLIAPVEGVCSTDIIVIRPISDIDTAVVAVLSSSDELIQEVSAGATGTRMPRASWNDVSSWPTPVLTDGERRRLARETQPLIDRSLALTLENRQLVRLRDALLPELLSGRIRVSEVHEKVDRAVSADMMDGAGSMETKGED